MAETKKKAAPEPVAEPEKAESDPAGPFDVDPKDVDPTGKTEGQVQDELMGREPPADAPESLPEPQDTTPPAAVYVDDRAVRLADVAAIQGVQVAPDASGARTVAEKDAFISEGMRNDLELNGWAIDPATGRKIVREQ